MFKLQKRNWKCAKFYCMLICKKKILIMFEMSIKIRKEVENCYIMYFDDVKKFSIKLRFIITNFFFFFYVV